MQVKKQLTLRAGTFLILFLFTSDKANTEFIIKSVNLFIQPRNEVQRGTNVSLICQAEVSQSPGSNPNYEYIFYKDYEMLLTEKTTATHWFYSIPDARVFHSGKYECAVVIGHQNKKSGSTDLTVKGLLTPVLSVDQQRLKEGDNVTAVCTAEGEMGSLMFSFRDGPVELYRKSTNTQKVEQKLAFEHKRMRTVNMFCYYSISLGSKIEISNNSNVIDIDIQELGITPEINVMPSANVIEGDLLTFSCNVDMTYQKNSELRISLVHGHTTLGLNMGQKTYNMSAKANDSGQYECIASLGAIHKSSSVNITVNQLFSVPALSIHPPEVFEGEHFDITCHTDIIASVRIQREDIKYFIYKEKTLVISNYRYSNTARNVTNGKYMCVAKANGIIKESSNVLFRAKVLVSQPEIRVDAPPVIVDKHFWIHCHSQNGSLPIIYTLKRNNITVNRTEVSNPHEKARFIAMISAPSDISSYFCEAENNGKISVKMSQRLNETVIVPVGKPLFTVIPIPGNIEEGEDVTLICGIPKGSPPINFSFYGNSHTPINTTTVQSNSSSFVLSAVSRQKSGNYYCEAFNLANKLSKSDIISIEVSLAKWKKILTVAFCLLILALVVIFIVLRYKAKRGRETYNPPASQAAHMPDLMPAFPKSDDFLIHESHYSGFSVGVNNKESVWSEKPPDISDEGILQLPNEGDVEYTEVVHSQPLDPTRIPLRKGTDTVYSELQTQGSPDHINHRELTSLLHLAKLLPFLLF
ncbi:platelet endothelial cell adhesion molecule isoform X4 [Danio rerio]|uniref:Platelet endothelial cell adhesion molecule isoform X4 n=1 Tax=Danio rerio TaxID=7955 RepID=A0AB32TXG1_DANRE